MSKRIKILGVASDLVNYKCKLPAYVVEYNTAAFCTCTCDDSDKLRIVMMYLTTSGGYNVQIMANTNSHYQNQNFAAFRGNWDDSIELVPTSCIVVYNDLKRGNIRFNDTPKDDTTWITLIDNTNNAV